jgi:hypothetical protein
MQPEITTLGEVLLHIYDYPFEAAIFLPSFGPYQAETRCIVGGDEQEDSSLRESCLEHGLVNWLNVAVVSDTCDDVSPKDIPSLVAAFNEDCRDGGWLHKMMNYRHDQDR